MKEIGGYLELDMNTGSMLHQDGILLNCGTLWPNVANDLPHDWWEWRLANDILPLPCDQRYDTVDMDCILRRIEECFL